MKLKHVFLSSLFLSTMFTACTNDEFAEFSNEANVKNAIALGEGFTINVSKNSADTRALFDAQLRPYWEKTDVLGAAWYNMVTEIEGTDEVKTCADFQSPGFYSNHPFTYKSGSDKYKADFESVTNAFAGAYVLYYPYTDFSITENKVPVELKSMEFDAKDVNKNINANMFAYGVTKFVPGGKQTGKFTLSQVPVLFSFYFTPDEKLNMDLANGITIKNIVVIAKKGGATVLAKNGKIVPNTTENIGTDVAYYNGTDEEKVLENTIVYGRDENADNLFVTVKNGDQADYKLLAKKQMTKKPFVFSALPFSEEADVVTIKVVTDKGVYAKTYDGNGTETENKILKEVNNAAKTGSQVSVNVTLDVTEEDGVIYTAEALEEAWKAAVAAGGKKTITIGTSLELTKALTCDKTNAKIEVVGEGSDATLTVPSMDLTGAVDFQVPVVVKEDLGTASSSTVLFKKPLTAKNVMIGGEATIDAKNIESLTVASTGVVNLKATVNGSKVDKLVLVTTGISTVNQGKLILTPNNLAIEKTEGAGVMTLEANMTNTKEIALENGTLDLNGKTFTNKGKMTGVVVDGASGGKFVNEAGGELTINGNTTMLLENKEADAANGLKAGVINVKGATLTANSSSSNAGIINVISTAEEAGILMAENLGQTETEAVINLEGKDGKSAEINFGDSKHGTAYAGYIVCKNTYVTITNNADDEPVAFNCTKADDFMTVTAIPEVTTLFLNAEFTIGSGSGEIAADNLKTKNLVVYKNLKVNGDLEMMANKNVTIEADVTMTGKDTGSLKFASTNNLTVVGNYVLTIGKGMTLDKKNATVDGNIIAKDGGKIENTTEQEP